MLVNINSFRGFELRDEERFYQRKSIKRSELIYCIDCYISIFNFDYNLDSLPFIYTLSKLDAETEDKPHATAYGDADDEDDVRMRIEASNQMVLKVE